MTRHPAPLSSVAHVVRLRKTGILRVSGADARAFLHGQLSTDIAHLETGSFQLAGWCSPKGRLLCVLRVVPDGEAFLLLMVAELIPAIMKRLKMFVLRAKVVIEDASGELVQLGVIGTGAAAALRTVVSSLPSEDGKVATTAEQVVLRLGSDQFLILASEERASRLAGELGLATADEAAWALEDIRHGIPTIVGATQDQFVPQMVNFERIGGIDFKKGCYPGQEIVARAQYRGQVKQRMARGMAPAGTTLTPGQALVADDGRASMIGTLVMSAPSDQGVEFLAVVSLAALAQRTAVRASPEGPALRWLQLPETA